MSFSKAEQPAERTGHISAPLVYAGRNHKQRKTPCRPSSKKCSPISSAECSAAASSPATLTGLAGLAAGGAGLAAAAPPSLKAITLNHVTVKVPNLQKTSKFYQEFFGMKLAQQSKTIHILSVGESFFGIEEKPGPAALDHYDFGLEGFDAKAMRAKVAAHGLQITPGSRGDDESFKFNDPDGFVVQVNGPKYTGHVGADVPVKKG
jgi:catechol 2,3-dioxygenase-like lactoylglutathione lyase family enzyme